MGIFSKLVTLARGTGRESAQVILDANALRIFEQEIIDVEQAIRNRKRAMCEVIASRKQIEREMDVMKGLIEKREIQANQLIQSDTDEALVEDIANEIADHELALEVLRNQKDNLSQRARKIEVGLQKALSDICRYRRDLRLARAQQIGSSHLTKVNHLPEQLSDLEETRTHVMSLQSMDDDRDEAWSEMEDRMDAPNIDRRLSDAGVGDRQARKEAILERLRGNKTLKNSKEL